MRLVLGGGGLACLLYIGAYETLISRGVMDKVTEIYGVSAGSFLGLGMVLRILPDEILNLFRENYPFNRDDLKMTNLITKYGFDSSYGTRRMIEKILEFKGLPKDAKMTDLASYDIQFKVCVTNLSTYSKELFTTKDDISIVDAVCASGTVPILFVPVCIKNEYYIDGGALWHSFPVELLKGKEDLGFCCMTKPCREENMTFWNYVSRLMTVIMMSFAFNEVEQKHQQVIYFEDIGVKLVSYDQYTYEEYANMFRVGRKYGEEYFEKQGNDGSGHVQEILLDGGDTPNNDKRTTESS
jgi:hypothetical protein